MRIVKDLREDACPLHRARKKNEGQVGQDNNPRPWEEVKFCLTREGQWQITGRDLKKHSNKLQKYNRSGIGRLLSKGFVVLS